MKSAWGCYHQAIDALAGHGWNEDPIAEALTFLRRAFEIDHNALALARAQFAVLSAIGENSQHSLAFAERIEEALAASRVAIADDPVSSDVLGLAGCALADLGHHQRGAEILQQACEIDPSNPEFWGEVQPPASLKGLDIPPRRAVFVPWKPSRRTAFGMGNPTFR